MTGASVKDEGVETYEIAVCSREDCEAWGFDQEVKGGLDCGPNCCNKAHYVTVASVQPPSDSSTECDWCNGTGRDKQAWAEGDDSPREVQCGNCGGTGIAPVRGGEWPDNPCEKHMNVKTGTGWCPICLVEERDRLRGAPSDSPGEGARVHKTPAEVAEGAINRLCVYDAVDARGEYDSTADRVAEFLAELVRILAPRLASVATLPDEPLPLTTPAEQRGEPRAEDCIGCENPDELGHRSACPLHWKVGRLDKEGLNG